jgi:hypothetical protein
MSNQVEPNQAFRDLLGVLGTVQKSEWERVSPSRQIVRQKIDTVLSRFLLTENSSRYFTPDVINLVHERKIIPLPPLIRDTHLVPFLTIYYDGNGLESSCCRIYVLLLGINARTIHGIGFRIESPESNCQEPQRQNQIGMHDFYHAQFFRSLREWEIFFRTPPWLPDSQPSFPLWAMRPIDALLNLILALYGAPYYLAFLREHGRNFASAISSEFKMLNQKLNR